MSSSRSCRSSCPKPSTITRVLRQGSDEEVLAGLRGRGEDRRRARRGSTSSRAAIGEEPETRGARRARLDEPSRRSFRRSRRRGRSRSSISRREGARSSFSRRGEATFRPNAFRAEPRASPRRRRRWPESFVSRSPSWRGETTARFPEIVYLVGSGRRDAGGARIFFQGELGPPGGGASGSSARRRGARPSSPRSRGFAKALSLGPLARRHEARATTFAVGAPRVRTRVRLFLREKVPLLTGLFAVVIFSFSLCNVGRASARWDKSARRSRLRSAPVTKDIFGESTTEPRRALELLDKTALGADDDPMPHVDAFDVMVQIAQAVPERHDPRHRRARRPRRGKVTVHGIVPTIPDAQQIATTLKTVRCFQGREDRSHQPGARRGTGRSTRWSWTSSVRPKARTRTKATPGGKRFSTGGLEHGSKSHERAARPSPRLVRQAGGLARGVS